MKNFNRVKIADCLWLESIEKLHIFLALSDHKVPQIKNL